MNKHQLACKAVLEWDEVAVEAKKRMAHIVTGTESFRTTVVLAKRFGVSKGYVGYARKLFLEDRNAFEQVLAGEAKLPIVRQTKKNNEVGSSNCLYRVYGENAELLYIGKTWNMEQRMADHARHSKWWTEFATMTVDRSFEDYDSLTKAETLAIRTERPKYNLEAEWFNSSLG